MLTPSLTSAPWWTGLYALVMAADAAAWIYALIHLPARRRSTILKVVTLCWLMLPLAAASVLAVHDFMVQHIRFHTAVFGKSTEDWASLLLQPTWHFSRDFVHWTLTYNEVGFSLLALVAITAVMVERRKAGSSRFILNAMCILPIAVLFMSSSLS